MKLRKLTPYKIFGSLALVVALSLPGVAEPGALKGKTSSQENPKDQRIADFARWWGLAAEHVAWANDREPTDYLQKGEKLVLPARILPGDPPKDGAVVNLAERGVYIFKGGKYVGFFPISIGEENNRKKDGENYRTPTGTFEIISREENPDWVAPDSDWADAMKKDRISGDDEDNPLGNYWWGIDAPGGGYGFHENTNPIYTGDAVSHGCMRFYPTHAKKIFKEKMLMPGMEVRIINDPVRVGTHDGDVYAAIFPPVYGEVKLRQRLTNVLRNEKLTEPSKGEKLDKVVREARGVPVKLEGSKVSVTIEGENSSSQVPAVEREDEVLVPSSAGKDLGLEVAQLEEEQVIEVSQGNKTQRFSLEPEGEEMQAYRYQDLTMVPLAALFEVFGIKHEWNEDGSIVQVEEM